MKIIAIVLSYILLSGCALLWLGAEKQPTAFVANTDCFNKSDGSLWACWGETGDVMAINRDAKAAGGQCTDHVRAVFNHPLIRQNGWRVEALLTTPDRVNHPNDHHASAYVVTPTRIFILDKGGSGSLHLPYDFADLTASKGAGLAKFGYGRHNIPVSHLNEGSLRNELYLPVNPPVTHD